MKEWKYLYSDAFKIRYVVAAHFLRDCPLVVEIGGYKTPISGFLKPGIKSVVIDPKTDPYEDQFTKHIKDHFQNVKLELSEPYGVAILGIEIHLQPEQWESLYEFLRKSQKVVVEVPVEHPPSVNQFEQILLNTGLKIKVAVKMDLSDNDFGDLTDSAPPKCKRNVYLLG